MSCGCSAKAGFWLAVLYLVCPGRGQAESWSAAPPEEPPRQVLDLNLGGAGLSRLKETGRVVAEQREFNEAVSFLQSRPLPGGRWFWGWGVRQELFAFTHRGGFSLSHLQDYAGQFSLEYYAGAQPLASLVIRPGFYFENTPTLSSWDIPFDFVTGIPIKDPVNGVIGIGHGRFYRHPIPVLGLSWLIGPGLQLDAVYPEPSLTVAINKELEARLGGELLGGGFRTDSQSERSSVEFFLYRIGAKLTWEKYRGIKIIGGAGYETERSFDFFREHRRLHGGGAPYLELGLQLSRYSIFDVL